MKIVVGLGNPGSRYEHTRHNVGWMVVDALAEKSGVVFSFQKRLQAEIGGVDDTLLVKPQTFMNKSGSAVERVTGFYKVSTDKLYVIHDDLDIALGEYKIQQGKGPRQHNGLQSIYTTLGAKDFWHVRVGIENREGALRLSGDSPFDSAQGRHRARIAQAFGSEAQARRGDTASLESLDAVSRKEVKVSGEEYVLQPFRGEEKMWINEVIEMVVNELSRALIIR